MNYLTIDLFNDFECIADSCPNTCCAGWKIIIDNETYQKMKEKEEELGIPVEKWLTKTEDYAIVKLENGRCCMLNKDNLCNVVLNLGSDYLSNTCTQYPRIFSQYGNVTEATLTTSCPEIILKLMKKASIQFDLVEISTDSVLYEHSQLYLFESAVRSNIINLLQANQDIALNTRLFLAFTILEKSILFLQNNQPDFSFFQKEITIYHQKSLLCSIEKQLNSAIKESSRYCFLQKIHSVLLSTSHQERFQKLINNTIEYFSQNNIEKYLSDISAFKSASVQYEKFYTNYWICHIFSDILAIPDYNMAKEKFVYIAAEFCLIQTVALANFGTNSFLDKDDYVYIISSVNRAMEHNSSYKKRLIEQLTQNNVINAAGLLLLII